MQLTAANPVLDQQLVSRFEEARDRVRGTATSQKLKLRLGHWALASDRRLPIALLDYSLKRILSADYEDLAGTPGIGHKKLDTLILLLHRAADDDLNLELSPPPRRRRSASGVSRQFDPAQLSETEWARWRTAIKKNDLGHVLLGQYCVSLARLPRVLWRKPLSRYIELTLDDLRKLRSYGTKRITSVLEVFERIYSGMCTQPASDDLSARLSPRSIVAAEKWLLETADNPERPEVDDVQVGFVRPLLEQIRRDGGNLLGDLAEARMGMGELPSSIRRTAHRLGYTRARVYQLLQMVGVLCEVRLPHGSNRVRAVRKRLPGPTTHEGTILFHAAADLFFPDTRIVPGSKEPLAALDGILGVRSARPQPRPLSEDRPRLRL
jgi:hypothetical protein